ncbi:MAG: DUF3426 domain-containing protein [Thermodesulfobacteriota bacterium]
MIIECEQCRSRFNLDERLLGPKGSKVRCSLCKHVFTAYLPEAASSPRQPDDLLQEDLEETVALDSPPILDEGLPLPAEGGPEPEFDMAFQEALEKESGPEAISVEQIPAEEPTLDMAEAIGRASRIEEQVSRMDMDAKGISGPREAAAEKPAPRKAARRSHLLTIILVVLVLIVGGSLGVYFFAPDLLPDSLSFLKPPKKLDVTDAGVARLSFKDVKGTFVQTEKAGQLFVIQGVITNNYPKARSFILVKGSLLDDKGKVVKSKMAYAGNSFTEERIKAMPLEEINKELKNRFGANKANLNIKPEAGVPFTIVIEELPDNLSEFTVEAVSSSQAVP